MPLHRYGVLKGKAINSKAGTGSSPHFQIHIVDQTTEYRIAVNVKSQVSPSELLYLIDDAFRHPILDIVKELPSGFTALQSRPLSGAMDFIRGNLFDRTQMRALPHTLPGPDNDLNDRIGAYVSRAISDELATVYAFGERWGPENNKRDGYFAFLPGNGIHDIHMNQGNVQQYRDDDGVWQDGGMLIHFPEILSAEGPLVWPEQCVGLFLAFQSQAWHTDDTTGHALSGEVVEAGGDGRVRIIAALVNPEGDDVGKETVLVLNASPSSIDLQGWAIADKAKKKTILAGPVLQRGESTTIRLPGNGAQLGNNGGIITLLDKVGIKVDGVSYSREDASRDRWMVVF